MDGRTFAPSPALRPRSPRRGERVDPSDERPQGGVVEELRPALAVGDQLEGLIEQVPGAGAVSAIEADGPLALAADVSGRELDGQGVDPGRVEEGLDFVPLSVLDGRAGAGPSDMLDRGLGVGHCGTPLAQADAS